MSENLKCSKCGSENLRIGKYNTITGILSGEYYQLSNHPNKWLPNVNIHMRNNGYTKFFECLEEKCSHIDFEKSPSFDF